MTVTIGVKMNESLVKYLAGLLDADGSLSFQFRLGRNESDQYHTGLLLALHSSSAVDKAGFVPSLPELTGMGAFYKEGDKGQFFKWIVANRADLEMLLPRLIKHMVIKAKHWQWMLEIWREKRGPTISKMEKDALALASRESRKIRKGSLRTKTYPTWAWMAGFLDGDGWYTRNLMSCGTYKGKQYQNWQMSVGVAAHHEDAYVLDFIKNTFGGRLEPHGQTESVIRWKRNLGPRDRDFALHFLSKLARHAKLKRHKIELMIHHHQQRLTAPTPTGEVIV